MDFQPFTNIDGPANCGLLLLCDHARNSVPEPYGTLGLEASAFERHIGYDIGAENVTRGLAERLGCPAVMSTYSRLLIDPNRGEDDPTLVMRISDGTIITGNHPITADEISHRLASFHRPYHQAIDDQLDTMIASGINPMVFSIHTFTPSWKGIARPWQAAMLWDNDPRLNLFMIDSLRRDPSLVIGDNEPYDGALCNDTMHRHATRRGLAHGLIELRQDLVSGPVGVEEWVERLAPLLDEANKRTDMHEIRYYGSRTDGTAREPEAS